MSDDGRCTRCAGRRRVDHDEPARVPQRAELGDDLRARRRVPARRRRRRGQGDRAGRRRASTSRAGHDIGTPGRDVDVSLRQQGRALVGPRRQGRAATSGTPARWRSTSACAGAGARSPSRSIAMVQGACIAGGLMLAWVCDLIVAADDAFFADPVVRMGIPGVEYFAHPWVLGPRAPRRSCSPATGSTRAARLRVGHGQPGGAARRAGDRDARARRADRRDAAVRARAGQAGGQPVRGPDGAARRDGLGVRAAPLRARAQRRGRGRLPRPGSTPAACAIRSSRGRGPGPGRRSGGPWPGSGWPRPRPATRRSGPPRGLRGNCV